MSPAQRRFHEDDSRKRLLRAGNQIGKTRAGSAECWSHALGYHPFREVPDPGSLGWILCSDLKSGWSSVSQKLREIEPLGALDPSTHYDSVKGYRTGGVRGIRLRNGSLIIPKGSDQSVLALSSGTIDWCWIDELCKRDHFSEFRARGAVKNAPIWVTLTPIGRPCEWLRNTISGDPNSANKEPIEPDWSSHVVPLSPENCPHRTKEDIEQQILSIPPWERSIRISAGWESITIARRIPGFSDASIFLQGVDHPLENLTHVGIGADYGEIVSHTIFVLVAWEAHTETLYVLGEWSPDSRMTPPEEARGLRDHLLRPWGIGPEHVSLFRGDSNSAGRRSVAVTVNALLERAITEMMGVPAPLFHCKPPYKGPGSVLARSRIMSSAFLSGKMYIHEDCPRTIAGLRHWDGSSSTEKYKHSVDALGYISDCFLGLTAFKDDSVQYTIVR